MRLDEAKYRVKLSVKRKHVDPVYHEVEVEADNPHDAHTLAVKKHGSRHVRVHGSWNMDDPVKRAQRERYLSRDEEPSEPKVMAFPNGIKREEPKKPELKKGPRPVAPKSAAGSFADRVRASAMKSTNESTIKQLAKSLKKSHDDREAFVRALASKDPERVKRARKKMMDRNNELRRVSSRVHEGGAMKSFGEFITESRKHEIGTRVEILSGMPEFIGKRGTVTGHEKLDRYGGDHHRVRFDTPVHVNGIGSVTSDLWQKEHLRKVRN